MSHEEIINDALKITTQNEVPVVEQPRYMVNTAKIYSTVLCAIIVISAIVSLIVNIKRKSTKRIIFSIVLASVAIISQYSLEVLSLKYAMNRYEMSTIAPGFIILGILIIIAITLIVLIFKKKK